MHAGRADGQRACTQVIHLVNNTLPKLTCHTCRNKFHSGDARLPAHPPVPLPLEPASSRGCLCCPLFFVCRSASFLRLPTVPASFPPLHTSVSSPAYFSPRHTSRLPRFPTTSLFCETEAEAHRISVPVQVVQHVKQERVPSLPIAVVFVECIPFLACISSTRSQPELAGMSA